jgi:hypothetical protein
MIRDHRSRLIALASAGGVLVLAGAALFAGGQAPSSPLRGGPAAPGDDVPAAGPTGPADDARGAVIVREAAQHDLSKPLAEIPLALTVSEEDPNKIKPKKIIAGRNGGTGSNRPDPVLQPAEAVASTSVSAPGQNFDGVNNRNGVYPPDTNGDVGPNHYVQWVNLSLAIYSKTGTLLYGPTNGNTIFSGFAGPCSTSNNGDPIVLYDREADRWMVSQFAIPGGSTGYHQCIAISQTPDPTGAWYRYDFLYSTTKLNDYPHFGVWPDGYYMSVNQFTPSGGSWAWAGQGVAVFEREKMLLGQTARMVKFDLFGVDPDLGGMLPSDIDGPTAPPAGAPNPFMQFDDDAYGFPNDQLQMWSLHADWANTANSTFTKTIELPTAAADSILCGGSRNCIPQAGTSVKLDAISDRLMYRLQYRNFGDHESLVVNHTVDVSGADRAGIRWYELRNGGSGWSIFQQGTFSPDANHRWMGSAAMNGAGGIAIGYSVSSSTMYPSIRYTGRVASDPAGTLPQGEGTIIDGTGAQTGSASRWGDYSMLAVDPADDCTYWFTTEYLQTTGNILNPIPWRTRIASFTLPDCGGVPATGGIAGRVTDSTTSAGLSGATVSISGGTSTTTDGTGNYAFSGLAPATYSLTASRTGYTTSAPTSAVVTAGSTTTTDFVLVPVPSPTTTAWTVGATAQAVATGAGDNNGYESGSGNLFVLDGAVATDANSGTSSSQSCTSTARDKEDLSGFGFTSVPAAAAITGIEVRVTGRASSTKNAPKFCILLSKDGGASWTAGKTTSNLTTNLAAYTRGSATDTWGLAWSGADAGASFRVRIVDLANSTARTFSLDGVEVRLTYQ